MLHNIIVLENYAAIGELNEMKIAFFFLSVQSVMDIAVDLKHFGTHKIERKT